MAKEFGRQYPKLIVYLAEILTEVQIKRRKILKQKNVETRQPSNSCPAKPVIPFRS